MDLPAVPVDYVCKLVIIGDSGVGKTCVMKRFTRNEFSFNFVGTIGIDFNFKLVSIQDKMVKVQIWDTAGQEQYHSITTSYYRGAKAVVMAYDITNRKSFENTHEWIANFKRFGDDDVERLLIGNKCDLEEKRQVQKCEGEKIARDNKMLFSETSAKENINIESVFLKLLDQVVAKEIKKTDGKSPASNQSQNISFRQSEEKLTTSCCSL